MKVKSTFRTGKNGLVVEFRSAVPDDALLEIDYLKQVSDESPYLLGESEDVHYTEDEERAYILGMEENERALMLNAYINGRFIGNGSFDTAGGGRRMAHRADMGVALFKEYCGLGAGSLLIRELIEKAKECGYEILELQVFANNEPAIRLYNKLGFREAGRLKNAVKYKDGSYTDEIFMQKELR